MAPIISNFLFHDNENPVEEQKLYVELKIKIREHLKKRGFRKILAEILFDLQKDVSGNTRNRLLKLYRDFELHHDSLEKLKSWRWEVVSKGILELTEMDVQEAYTLISKFINDKRGVVRKQAEISVVKLRDNGIDHVLDLARYSISEWQQLKLIEALGNKENYVPPKFKSWLLSNNKHVVLFSLRLIKFFNQSDAEQSVSELVKHKNDDVKVAALHCIKDFGFVDSLQILKNVFWMAQSEVKIEILDTFGHLGSKSDVHFLQKAEKEEEDFLVKSKALAVINLIEPDSVLPTKDIEDVVFENDETEKVKHLSVYDVDEVIVQRDDSIEVDEVVSETIEHVKPVKKTEETTTKEGETEIKLDFELGTLDNESNHSLSNYLGLVETKQEEGFSKGEAKENFETSYLNLSYEEREETIGSIENSTSKLESIVDIEDNSELRFNAFNKLKQLKDATKTNEEATEDNVQQTSYQESIFLELYNYAQDVDSKLILLKEVADIGDKKEVAFLNHILPSLDGKLRKQAKDSIEMVMERCVQVTETLESETSPTIIPQAEEEKEVKTDKIPIELFLLYEEMGIEPSEEENSIEPDFDLFDVPHPLNLRKHG